MIASVININYRSISRYLELIAKLLPSDGSCLGESTIAEIGDSLFLQGMAANKLVATVTTMFNGS